MPTKFSPEIKVFDQMAPGWYSFRHYTIFRAELAALADRWAGGRLLNIGCGHGADFLPFSAKFNLVGLDFSAEMIKMARRYAHKFNFPVQLLVADARQLPFAENAFDWAIAIATYHHLQGRSDQMQALEELRRILKPGGEAFITVWNRSQPRFWFKGHEVPLPWKAKEGVIYRYYYLFTFREIQRLVLKAGFQVLQSAPETRYHFPVKYFARNICLLIKKSN
jgi:tRNA (uracil-5-)-methyltransferase TRM9